MQDRTRSATRRQPLLFNGKPEPTDAPAPVGVGEAVWRQAGGAAAGSSLNVPLRPSLPCRRRSRRFGRVAVRCRLGETDLRTEEQDGGTRRGPRCHHPAPRRRQTTVISQFAFFILQSLIRRKSPSRIRAIRVTSPRRRLLFNGKPEPTDAPAPVGAGEAVSRQAEAGDCGSSRLRRRCRRQLAQRATSSLSVGHERLLKKSDAPCPLGAELSATGLPPAIPRAPGALTPRGFGTCQLPARTTRSRRPSPETSFLWVRSEAARLTA
jgi:hypothetical protein